MHRCQHTHYLSMSAAVGMLLVAALGCGPGNGSLPAPVLSRAEPGAPAGAEGFAGIEWVRVPAPGGMLTAGIARPPGAGPFPVLVVLHGTHGFAREYVRLAQDLAREGNVVTVAGCWFAGGQGGGRKLITPIDCPDAPAMSAHWSPEALESISALVAAARELPGVRSDRVALFGHSRGAGGALHYVVERGGVRAAVLNSAGFDEMVIDRAPAVNAPLLLLHGMADGPADGTGGNEVTAFDKALEFESALRKENKPVEVNYFDGAHHNSLFTDAKQYDETVRLVAAFLRRRLAG
jgi:dienelactone hydrolase